MSSTQFVRTADGIPAGPISDNKPTRRTKVAIIRPAPANSGLTGNLRLDEEAAETPRPHKRTHDLESYVGWLREKIERDRNSATELDTVEELPQKTVSSNSQSDGASPVSHPDKPAKPLVAVESTPEGVLESISAEPEDFEDDLIAQVQAAIDTHVKAKLHMEKHLKSRGFSKEKVTRVDSPHAGLASPHVSIKEEPSAMLEEIENLIHQTSVLQDLGQATPVETTGHHDANQQSVGQTGGGEGDPQFVPATSLTKSETEQLIETVSKAIASVLTDQSEVQIEQELRSHFESETHSKAVEQIQLGTDYDNAAIEDAIGKSVEEVVAQQISQLSPEPEAQEPIAESTSKEIPTSVAAWDVEDFRWPSVCSQIIVNGGDSLEHLFKATSSLVTAEAKRFAVCGLNRGDGTSSIATSLARWASASGNNVLLIDADISNPKLSRNVGLAPNISWINCINKSLPIAEVVVRSRKSNLCIMPMSQIVARAAWPRFIYDNLGELVKQVSEHFDLILMDVGPATQLMDELSQCALLADGVLMVHDGGNTPKFRKTKNLLNTFGVKKIVVAQNRVPQSQVNVA